MEPDMTDTTDSANGTPRADLQVCQIRAAPPATRDYNLFERLGMALDKKARRARQIARKIAADPAILLRKAAGLRTDRLPEAGADPAAPAPRPAAHGRPARPLAPGDRVRVRSYEEIAATFDGLGSTGGMSYLGIVMAKFEGRTFTVRGRVERFFDERHWKMLKLRDTVILDGVYCEPPKEAGVDWAGCGRSCFLFWKEAWLERIDSPLDVGDPAAANARR
jgi:hypothetical protein